MTLVEIIKNILDTLSSNSPWSCVCKLFAAKFICENKDLSDEKVKYITEMF